MCRTSSKPSYELADVIKKFGPALRATGNVCAHHLRTLSAIESCRTAALGGHLNVCTDCGTSKISYNSCRNRHCPKCGGLQRELWIKDREAELLPLRYQHIVFTLPQEFNPFCQFNPGFCYSLLFRAAWKTLDTFARDPKWLGARTGATMVLHTWGQNLSLHPHVHCIVPSGGLRNDGSWARPQVLTELAERVQGRSGFLFPVKAMSKVFRAIFLRHFMAAWNNGILQLPPEAPTKPADIQTWRSKRYRQDWVVYAKFPFTGPQTVVEYLGRYTHKVAISNHRIIEVECAITASSLIFAKAATWPLRVRPSVNSPLPAFPSHPALNAPASSSKTGSDGQ